jgi:type 1 glutamine amidotransferase/nicotinamidase-related amidase
MPHLRIISGAAGICLSFVTLMSASADEPFSLDLRYRSETGENTGRYHTFWKKVDWEPKKTAVIVCDMWDSHHSVTAVRRVNELAPHLNDLLKAARRRGATIIHAPSDCMELYQEHAARVRALGVPAAKESPDEIAAWSYRIPAEEEAQYPLDQSDGGEDESAWENAQWNATLKAEGRTPGTPWLAQNPALEIEDGDYIAAEGDVVWNILKYEGVEHVALTGVHTNMCVLGRPFGLRRMVAAGMDTVLVRDCTDLMYNPERWPYVSHFTGLDLIVDYIEAHVCPTVASDHFMGGEPFRFSHDRRPHLAILIGEQEYETAKSLPKFARRFLGGDFRVTVAFAAADNRNAMPGVRAIEDADLLLVSVRRRGLSAENIGRIRRFVESGKPVLGIRTANHAFAPKEELPDGHEAWMTFDSDVFGGNYTGHHGNKKAGSPKSFSWVAKEAAGHPVVKGMPEEEWKTTSWLYKTSPLVTGANVLVMGKVEGREPAEPLAWTYVRKDGGRSFYTSLGHVDDFEDRKFQRLLVNAIYWAAGLEAPEKLTEDPNHRRWGEGWSPVATADVEADYSKLPAGKKGSAFWVRTLIKAPVDLKGGGWTIDCPKAADVYLNGEILEPEEIGAYQAPLKFWKAGGLNLVAIRFYGGAKSLTNFGRNPPRLEGNGKVAPLDGNWQMRVLEKEKDGEQFPIPPQFGAPADLIQNWPFLKRE